MVIFCKEGKAEYHTRSELADGNHAINCTAFIDQLKASDIIPPECAHTSLRFLSNWKLKLFDKILELHGKDQQASLFVELDNEIEFSLWMFLNRNGIHYTFQPDDFSREEIQKITGRWLIEDFDGDMVATFGGED